MKIRHMFPARLCGAASVGSVLVALTAAVPAMAQADEPAAALPDTAPVQSDIVVTARRRSESLERVPVAVTALGSKQLAQQSILTQNDLQRTVPGLLVRQTASQNSFVLSMRGQSVDAYSGSSPAVLAYINDVQQSSLSPSSFYDLDSIQVLKGPQGTLFGRNVTGGAVLYATTKPSDTFGGYVTMRAGNYGMMEGQGAVDIPISGDSVLLRVAGDVLYRDGYVYNYFDDQRLGVTRRQSGRATLLIKPVDGLQNVTVFQYNHAGGNNIGNELYSVYPCGATNNGIALTTTAGCLFQPGLDAAIAQPGAWQAYLDAHPKAYPGGINEFLKIQKAMGPWKVNEASAGPHRSHDWFVTNTTTYALHGDTQIKNIFGASKSYSKDITDQVGAPYGVELEVYPTLQGTGYAYRSTQASEELQLLGKAFGEKLNYIVGVYFASEVDEGDFNLAPFDLSPSLPPTPIRYHYKTRDHTEAFFLQGTYDLSGLTGIDGLSVTGGFRYTWEQIRLQQLEGSKFFGRPSESARFSKPSWQVGLEYQANSQLLLYVEQRGSWRSGGFSGTAPPVLDIGSNGGNEYLPETTYDVEVGAKYSGRVLGRPTRVNFAFYNQWISNVQRTEYAYLPDGSLSSVTANIPKAEVTGVEFDANIQLADWLQAGGNVAWTNARYTSPNSVLFGEQLTYGPYGDSARWSGSAFAQVNLPVPESLGKISLRGDVYAQTHQYFSNFDATINPESRLPGYTLVNGRIDWEVAHTTLNLAAFVKNIFNKGYFVGGLAQGPDFGLNGALPGEPRMYGVEATVKF